MAKPTCFIIAPITTPPERVGLYRDDPNHFGRVMEKLLIPAVEKAEMTPIRPIAEGADLIHAEIIRNLQDADLVLCDMSSLNPNVFFELGVRTALNKPVCLVRDEQTERTPFDVGSINNHTYVVTPWTLEDEVLKLAAHVRRSAGAGDNALWKYFGLRIKAEATRSESQPTDKLDLLMSEVAALRKEIRPKASPPAPALIEKIRRISRQRDIERSVIEEAFRQDLRELGVDPAGFRLDVQPDAKEIVITGKGLTDAQRSALAATAHSLGWAIGFGA